MKDNDNVMLCPLVCAGPWIYMLGLFASCNMVSNPRHTHDTAFCPSFKYLTQSLRISVTCANRDFFLMRHVSLRARLSHEVRSMQGIKHSSSSQPESYTWIYRRLTTNMCARAAVDPGLVSGCGSPCLKISTVFFCMRNALHKST